MQFYESSSFIYLWLIPLFILIFRWGRAERLKRLSRWGSRDFLERRLMPGYSFTQQKIAWGLLMVTFLLATMALARPQWGEEKKRVERKGVDLVFLLDTSLSMLAEDVKPNRLTKSKLEIRNLVRRLKGDRLGMVAFSGSSFLQCPLTLDYSAFLLFVDALKPGYIPNPGTSLSQAIGLGIRAFPEESRKYRAILIFSDGEDHEGGIEEALGEAKKAGVRLYAIGVGTLEGEPIPLRSGTDQKITGYKKDRQGAVVVTRLNAPLLTRTAKETGGLYLPATAGEKEIDVILKHLESLGERQLKERLIAEREDHFQAFLLLALFLLVGEALLHSRRVPPITTPLSLVLAFMFLTGFIDTPRSLVQKGNRQTEEKKYQSAVENYRKAQIADPNEPVIRYNLGTSLYQLYEYADAEKELEQALLMAKDPAAKAKILYNYGNTKYRLGDFEKAIDSYKKVLEIDPKDDDAKYNLEFLIKKKSQFEQKNNQRQNQENKSQKSQQDQQQQQPQPQPQTDQPQNQKQQEQNQNSEQQQNNQQKEKQDTQGTGGQNETDEEKQGSETGQDNQEKEDQKDQKEKESGQKDKPRDQEPGQEQKDQQQVKPHRQEQGQESDTQNQKEEDKEKAGQSGQQGPPLQGQMSKEDALRILEILKDGEKGLQDLRRPPVSPGSDEVLKDW